MMLLVRSGADPQTTGHAGAGGEIGTGRRAVS